MKMNESESAAPVSFVTLKLHSMFGAMPSAHVALPADRVDLTALDSQQGFVDAPFSDAAISADGHLERIRLSE